VVALRFVADVCASCGEKYLQRSDVSMIEDVRRRLDQRPGGRAIGGLLNRQGCRLEPGAWIEEPSSREIE
jgi:hypothetical protein